MAINDCDCCCDLPMPVADEELEAACNRATPFDDGLPATSPLSGFLAFAQLCQISGKVHSLQSPTRIASLNTPRGQKRMMALGKKLEKMLDVWLNGLPDEIRFSAKYVICFVLTSLDSSRYFVRQFDGLTNLDL